MNRQMIHDDHILGLQSWNKNLAHIFKGSRAVHGAVEDHWRGDRSTSQRGDEGRGFAVTMWCVSNQALAFRRSAAEPRHVRRGRGFINEHQALRDQRGLIFAPGLTCCFDVRAILFGGVQSFF